MKLLRLKINDLNGFRSLKESFEVVFLREWDFSEAGKFNPYILAGPNGSGKSNVLEALASIFYHIECIYLNFLPKKFIYDEVENQNGFKAEVSSPDAFELEYLIPVPGILDAKNKSGNAHIKISKEVGETPKILWLNRDNFDADNKADPQDILARIEVKQLLPKYILGYSSGENEILSLPFFKMRFIHFDEYRNMLLSGNQYSTTEGRLTFMDKELSQAIVLSNFLIQDEETLEPFSKELDIEKIKEFRIIIHKYIEMDPKRLREYQESLEEYTKEFEKSLEEIEDEEGNTKKRLDITRKLSVIIESLKKCSTTHYYDVDNDSLYLDYWVNDATKEAFRLHFGSAKELFQAFQILLALNLYSVSDKLKKELYESSSLYVNETVPVLPSDERIMQFKDLVLQKCGVKNTIYSKSLSDGEHQFMHSLGLCLLYKDDNCLFLLDEPETHFNPDWRAKFISRLRACFAEGKAKDTMREMLITTHTPFLISDSKPEYVLLFEKSKGSNNVTVSLPKFNTLGASINKITIEAFGNKETIGGYAKTKLDEFDKRLKQGEDQELIINEVNETLGDSVEKILFINSILKRRGE